mgnify:CR=1 FL=1
MTSRNLALLVGVILRFIGPVWEVALEDELNGDPRINLMHGIAEPFTLVHVAESLSREELSVQ